MPFQYEPSKRLPVQSQELGQILNMFTVNNKDTRTTPLTSLILNIVNIDIPNNEQRLSLSIRLRNIHFSCPPIHEINLMFLIQI